MDAQETGLSNSAALTRRAQNQQGQPEAQGSQIQSKKTLPTQTTRGTPAIKKEQGQAPSLSQARKEIQKETPSQEIASCQGQGGR